MASDVTRAIGGLLLSTVDPPVNGSSLSWNGSLNATEEPDIFYEFYQVRLCVHICDLCLATMIYKCFLGGGLQQVNCKQQMI